MTDNLNIFTAIHARGPAVAELGSFGVRLIAGALMVLCHGISKCVAVVAAHGCSRQVSLRGGMDKMDGMDSVDGGE
jgi:hypothetical protein